VLASFVISSNETLKGQIVEMQARAMQERVEKGSMTQEQADQATEQMQGMGTLFAVFGAVAGVVGTALLYFVGTLFLWLIGKFALKAAHGYSTYLALYGISSWIAVLGSVMTVLMMVGLNSMYATPSAALAVYADFDSLDTTHRLLSKLGLFSIWQAVVIGIGLSKVSGKPTGIGIGFSFGLLALWIALSMWVGF